MEKDKSKKKGKVKKILKYVGITVLTAFGITLAVSPKFRGKTVEVIGNLGNIILGDGKTSEKKPNRDEPKPERRPEDHPRPRKRWGGYYNKPRYNNKKQN